MLKTELLGIPLNLASEAEILEQIKKGASQKTEFSQIVSINPENMITILENEKFKDVVVSSQSHIPDGMGVVRALQLLSGVSVNRLTGADLMETVLSRAEEYSLRVILIGGKENLANYIAECYGKRFPRLDIRGFQGISDIRNPKKEEEKAIFHIVATVRPHIVFVSFGSPAQELWIHKHKKEFSGSIVMGVGGAFDFISGNIPRAPILMRRFGLEWLFRLLIQPWRIKRQVRLLKFAVLVIRERLTRWRSRS